MATIRLNENKENKNLVVDPQENVSFERDNNKDLVKDQATNVLLGQINNQKNLVSEKCEEFVWTTIEW